VPKRAKGTAGNKLDEEQSVCGVGDRGEEIERGKGRLGRSGVGVADHQRGWFRVCGWGHKIVRRFDNGRIGERGWLAVHRCGEPDSVVRFDAEGIAERVRDRNMGYIQVAKVGTIKRLDGADRGGKKGHIFPVVLPQGTVGGVRLAEVVGAVPKVLDNFVRAAFAV
jgi:hypothetical protein